MFKKLQVDQGIPGSVPFGKGMGLAGEGIEPIAEHAVDPVFYQNHGKRAVYARFPW
ncbi:hypothetical protein KSB_59950 [Ktedonobacter robiniae]|uniref:Uncharacterized protein n=1 Tax=Ktedonobacter robiniae TaxID=2778365 RepID=A0ABQ3UZ04_9CHLR|nr:hypothetical protein KSB_59950 [Ktedonobacter robiniae]